VLTVRGTERFIDVIIEAFDKRRAESGVIRLFTWVEAEVLQEFNFGAQLSQATTHGSNRVLLNNFTLWAPKVGAGNNGGAASQQVLKQRQGSANTEVVSYLELAVNICDRAVEVNAHQDALALKAPPPFVGLEAHNYLPMRLVRSTRRLE